MKKSTLVEFIAILFIILFLYTSLSKLMDYNLYEEQLSDSDLLKPFVPVLAWLLPVVEIVTAVILFIPATRIKGLYISLVLMIVFSLYILWVLNVSPHIPCSCGGMLEGLSWSTHLVFNGICVLLLLAGIVLNKQKQNNKQESSLSYLQS